MIHIVLYCTIQIKITGANSVNIEWSYDTKEKNGAFRVRFRGLALRAALFCFVRPNIDHNSFLQVLHHSICLPEVPLNSFDIVARFWPVVGSDMVQRSLHMSLDDNHCEGAGVDLCDSPFTCAHINSMGFSSQWPTGKRDRRRSVILLGVQSSYPLEGNKKKIWANIGNSQVLVHSICEWTVVFRPLVKTVWPLPHSAVKREELMFNHV